MSEVARQLDAAYPVRRSTEAADEGPSSIGAAIVDEADVAFCGDDATLGGFNETRNQPVASLLKNVLFVVARNNKRQEWRTSFK